MGRWEPGARGRLEEAALALYSEHGFENTTVADIAGQAGLTERTFFRHFADKREVLFGGASRFQDELLAPVVSAPDSASPLEAVAAGLAAAAALLEDRRDFARRRQTIIGASAELRERELSKFAALADALAVALVERGLTESAARLTAEVALAVFRNAFERWLEDGNDEGFAQLIRESLDELMALTASG
jgi:AcrR family transcriptional regulator